MIKTPLKISVFCLLFIVLLVVLFCFFRNVKEGILSISIDDNNLRIENKLPISDELGRNMTLDASTDKVFDFISFSIENTSKVERTYTILLTKTEDITNEILERYVKVYLTDENDLAYPVFKKSYVPVYSDFLISNKKPGSRVLYKDKVKPFEKKEFNLRIWLSDSYIIMNEKQEFSFDVEIY